MEVLNLRPTRDAGTLVALFDLQATPEITIKGWQLRDTRKGLRVFPPPARIGPSAVLIEPKLFSTIGRLAAAKYLEGNSPHVATQ